MSWWRIEVDRPHLAKLAQVLYEVFREERYPPFRFDMRNFCLMVEDLNGMPISGEAPPGRAAECGTVACAAGHISLFWPRTKEFRSWIPLISTYTFGREDGIYSQEGNIVIQWIYGGGWAAVDNTPYGAAQRIWYFLEHGIPQKFLRTRTNPYHNFSRSLYEKQRRPDLVNNLLEEYHARYQGTSPPAPAGGSRVLPRETQAH